jgi:hypothetical protein
MANAKPTDADPEINAIAVVYEVLRELDSDAQKRVLGYVAGKLGVSSAPRDDERPRAASVDERVTGTTANTAETEVTEEAEGISPVALKWMRRSGLAPSNLSALFSLGVDEIDLVAKKVPGAGKKDRMHSVLLLKGISSYLSTGVARVTHEQLKEACLHYDAFDTTNFARYLKDFASEAAGTKESGYTLTARGLTNATEIIRGLASVK